MSAALRLLRREVGVALETALAMVSRNVAEALGIGERKGRLAPGTDAEFVDSTTSLQSCGSGMVASPSTAAARNKLSRGLAGVLASRRLRRNLD